MKSLYIKKFNIDILLPSLQRKGSRGFSSTSLTPNMHEIAALCLLALPVCRKRFTAADKLAHALGSSIRPNLSLRLRFHEKVETCQPSSSYSESDVLITLTKRTVPHQHGTPELHCTLRELLQTGASRLSYATTWPVWPRIQAQL